MDRSFRDYPKTRSWITVIDGQPYPGFLDAARELYTPVLDRFAQLATDAVTAEQLLRSIMDEPQPLRRQLLRVFRKYVSPDTAVEMLKGKRRVETVIEEFGEDFRAIEEVQRVLEERTTNDDVLFALLYEYSRRGEKGYLLTEAFFAWFRSTFGEQLAIQGPERAGSDIILSKALPEYPVATPADFLISRPDGSPLVVGFARYDSDRGGAQEDDRLRGNNDNAATILRYADERGLGLRVVFVNDGPGLLLGSMWKDYAALEDRWNGRVMVCALKMLEERITYEWLTGQ